jgi:hypothetical protein
MLARPSHPEPVETLACEVCLAEIPRSVAQSQEATDYVHYFCGVHCYDQWRKELSSQVPAESTPAKR